MVKPGIGLGVAVHCDLNREIKIVFDDNNASIPFPQGTVSYDEGSDKTKVSNVVTNEAEEFWKEKIIFPKISKLRNSFYI